MPLNLSCWAFNFKMTSNFIWFIHRQGKRLRDDLVSGISYDAIFCNNGVKKRKEKNASCCHPMGAKKLGTCCDSACKPNCIRRNPFKLIDSRTGVNISNTVTLWRVTSSIKPLQVIFLSPGQRADLSEVPLDGLEHVRHLLTDTTKHTISVLGWTIQSAVGQ